MKSKVYFADEKIKKAFEELRNSKTEDQMLYKWIKRAIDDLSENALWNSDSKKDYPGALHSKI